MRTLTAYGTSLILALACAFNSSAHDSEGTHLHVARTLVEGSSTDIQGATYSIGNGFTGGTHPEGSHFHSSNLAILPPGNPDIIFPGAAEVGGFFGDEEVRGLSEFEVGSSAVDEAVLSFDILDLFEEGLSPEISGVGGLFGQEPLEGVVEVYPYIADHLETVSDYQVPTLTELPILTIQSGDGLVLGGDTFSVDITSIYNDRVAAGEDLGFRLQMADANPDAGAITFHNFRISVVPEPTGIVTLLIAVATSSMFRRRRG